MSDLIDITSKLGYRAVQNRRTARRRRKLVVSALSHLRVLVEAARGLHDEPWDEFERDRLERLFEGADPALKVLLELVRENVLP